MPDWTKSMKQTFEYYIVDPYTWTDISKCEFITASTVKRDLKQDTLGSASLDTAEEIPEVYVRVYLVTEQKSIEEHFPLGTFLCQTPSTSFDGRVKKMSVDAYTPLTELKEKYPPVGYFLGKGTNVLNIAYRITNENVRAPVVETESSLKLSDSFVSELDDTWFTYLTDLLTCAGYRFDLDDMGRILFAPEQDLNSMNPVWTYNDDNSSILFPDVDHDRDLYGIPNVLEVVYSMDHQVFVAKAVNDDPNSPVSTVSRGREVVNRITDPDIVGAPEKSRVISDKDERDAFQTVLNNYARQTLRDLSSFEYTLTYSHGYNPVRPGDCVLFNYTRAGLNNIKAKVISQSISCSTGCKVEETAVYTTSLWGSSAVYTTILWGSSV